MRIHNSESGVAGPGVTHIESEEQSRNSFRLFPYQISIQFDSPIERKYPADVKDLNIGSKKIKGERRNKTIQTHTKKRKKNRKWLSATQAPTHKRRNE